MNNKKIGTDFERELCEILASFGWWVHFMSPDNRGAQPFDLIAVKDGVATAIDCKTSARRYFGIERLEDNQIMAFEKWLACGNSVPIIAVKHKGAIYFVSYLRLRREQKVDLKGLENEHTDKGA